MSQHSQRHAKHLPIGALPGWKGLTDLRYFALDGTDHADHKQQSGMIRRYLIWRNRYANDQRLRAVVDRADVA